MPYQIRIRGSEEVDQHVEYEISIEDNGVEWVVYRRYDDFLALDASLKSLPVRHRLPSKGLFGLRKSLGIKGFMARRQRGLEEYLTVQLEQVASLATEEYLREQEALTVFLARTEHTPCHEAGESWYNRCHGHAAHTIRAEGAEEFEADCADTIGLLGFEVFMGSLPLANSGTFGIACTLGVLDDSAMALLFVSLQAIVTTCPHFAGRVRHRSIALCNSGVPVTVVKRGDACPVDIPHEDIFGFCDMRAPSRIMAGREPLLTVQVTTYPDGAVLGVAASHCIMDGSSLFGFLHSWGCLCRGEPHGLRPGFEGASRAPLRAMLKRHGRESATTVYREGVSRISSFLNTLDDSLPSLFQKAESLLHRSAASAALAAAATIVPRMLGAQSDRVRLVIPSSRIEALKVASAPPPEFGGDGWVSTQEAVLAHLLRSLWASLMAGAHFKHGGCARVSMMVDVRRHLGLQSNFHFGTGFQVVDFLIHDMPNKSLPQCAADIHEGCRGMGKQAKEKWHLFHHAFEDCVRLDQFVRDAKSQRGSDLTLTVNNNSKRNTPDFGAAGGPVSGFMSSMGPTLLLTSRLGLEIILDNDLFAAASDEKKSEFLGIFNQLP